MSKSINITISFDDEKLIALQTYLEQRNTTVEKELTAAMEQIYTKNVPVAARGFLEMKAGGTPPSTVSKPRKKKLAVPVENATPPPSSSNVAPSGEEFGENE